MRCQLCHIYHTAERVKLTKNKDTMVINRYCPHRKVIVTAEDETCEKFSPTQFFWCKGWQSWTSVIECQARIQKERGTCPCSLGVEVMELKPIKTKQLVIRRQVKKLIVRRSDQ